MCRLFAAMDGERVCVHCDALKREAAAADPEGMTDDWDTHMDEFSEQELTITAAIQELPGPMAAEFDANDARVAIEALRARASEHYLDMSVVDEVLGPPRQ